MSADHVQLEGPNLTLGVALSAIPDGTMLKGYVGDQAVLLVRRGGDMFAVGAQCTHYGGPLVEGVIVGETIRCPWHHACFDLRSGDALRAPARDPLPRWGVEVLDGIAYVLGQLERQPCPKVRASTAPESVVIVGGGAAGNMAAETLRDAGYDGPITMVSADAALPADRPNLSKDYLAGRAPEAWTLLRPADFYRHNDIGVRLNMRVARLDIGQRAIDLADGNRLSYGALLLATGAEPIKLEIPGADLGHVHYLRTLDDSQALIIAAKSAKKAVIVGAGFIGLEAASSLRARGLEIHVVGREKTPMARLLGRELGSFIRSVHEDHGVRFHLGRTVASIDEYGVTLDNGENIDADLVLVGIGVRPATSLAELAGLAIDRGVLVDRFLETSAEHVFAAGDIARWPDPHSGQAIRVEHFVVAERQGQTAARNMLGRRQPFDDVPFFWTEQHDIGIAYVGHAERWDEIVIDGSIEMRDCSISYFRNGRKQAVAMMHRDHEGLLAELEFESAIDKRRSGHPPTGKLTEAA
jgi:NADPH-dependent 2,4-dienoyl-CoA reductase/sulfur reductase-like enzyme/nitrite reductase/ring-hydroxylating ferredoxin subunit